MYYSKNCFEIRTKSSTTCDSHCEDDFRTVKEFECLLSWIRRIGHANARRLRNVRVGLWPWRCELLRTPDQIPRANILPLIKLKT